MGKLAWVVLLAGGYWAWQNDMIPVPAELAAPSPAWEAYTRFSQYLAHGQYGNARGMAARAGVRAVQIRELRGRRNTRLGISGQAASRDDLEWQAKGDLLGVSHDVISEVASADGQSVKIEAVQRVCRRQAGCEENEHTVEMCQVGQEWKVCSFRE